MPACVCFPQSYHVLVNPELSPVDMDNERTSVNVKGALEACGELEGEGVLPLLGVSFDGASGLPKWLATPSGYTPLSIFLKKDLTKPLALHQFTDICKGVLTGIVRLHASSQGHFTLSPDHVYVSGTEEKMKVCVGDVALGALASALGRLPCAIGQSLWYAAPEVLLTGPDLKSDVFSFGFMMAEIVLTSFYLPGTARCEWPFSEYGLTSRFQLVSDACARLTTVCAPLADLISLCCAKEPRLRPTSHHVLAQLEEILLVTGACVPVPGLFVVWIWISLHVCLRACVFVCLGLTLVIVVCVPVQEAQGSSVEIGTRRAEPISPPVPTPAPAGLSASLIVPVSAFPCVCESSCVCGVCLCELVVHVLRPSARCCVSVFVPVPLSARARLALLCQRRAQGHDGGEQRQHIWPGSAPR